LARFSSDEQLSAVVVMCWKHSRSPAGSVTEAWNAWNCLRVRVTELVRSARFSYPLEGLRWRVLASSRQASWCGKLEQKTQQQRQAAWRASGGAGGPKNALPIQSDPQSVVDSTPKGFPVTLPKHVHNLAPVVATRSLKGVCVCVCDVFQAVQHRSSCSLITNPTLPGAQRSTSGCLGAA